MLLKFGQMVNSNHSQDADNVDRDTGGRINRSSKDQSVANRQETKKFIGKFFVASVVMAITVIPAVSLWTHVIDINGYKDMVLTLAGVLSGPVGIIVNNYFREGDDG